DPEVYHQIWFSVMYAAREPFLSHNASDATCTPKFAESFPLMRWASGSEEFQDLEQKQMENLLANIDPNDGLYYAVWKPDRPWHSDYLYDEHKQEDWAWVGGLGRMMRAMMTWRQRDGDDRWDPLLRNMARGMDRIAIHKDDYAYYPDGGF